MPRYFVSITASQPLTTEIVVEADDKWSAMDKAYDLASRHVNDIEWEEQGGIEDIDADLCSAADDDEELTTFKVRRPTRY